MVGTPRAQPCVSPCRPPSRREAHECFNCLLTWIETLGFSAPAGTERTAEVGATRAEELPGRQSYQFAAK
jgi:hypothetical protein